MAMPSEKMTWPDERDGLISWLRGEFAAANAIIDSLCHHLRAVGDFGEYDAVIGSIQQRRCNWNTVLHMQQYFSVAEVINAVQQATWRHQQSRHSQNQPRFYDSDVKAKRFGSGAGTGFKPGGHVWSESFGNSGNAGPARGGAHEKVESRTEAKPPGDADFVTKTQEDASSKISGNSEVVSELSEPEALVDDERTSSSKENDSNSTANQNKNSNLAIVPKTFVGNEMFDGKLVNAVEGLKLYEDFYSDAEVLKLFAMVNELRSAGKRGQLQGQTFITSKRPSKGHGREMIQFGLPISDSPIEDEVASGSSKDKRIEAIPPLLQGVAESLLSRQVTAVKPDSCIIDFYNEGDHSQPYMWPLWFGKPICVLFLTECDMTFGRIVTADHPGDYKGVLRLSLKPGSLLALQGKSVDLARYAIPSLRRQRALVILTKSQPKKSMAVDGGPRVPPPPSRPPNHHHIRHTGLKHYAPVSNSGVFPAPPIQPVLPAMPVSVPAPPGSSVWPAGAPPRHPVPGTGVFFPPPGSDRNSSSIATNVTVESSPLPGKENGSGKMIGVKGKVVDVKAENEECNGSAVAVLKEKEEQDQSIDNTAMNN